MYNTFSSTVYPNLVTRTKFNLPSPHLYHKEQEREKILRTNKTATVQTKDMGLLI